MPGLDGLEATRRLLASGRRRGSIAGHAPADRDPDDVRPRRIRLRRAPGRRGGFLLKDVSPEHLVGAVRTVAVGDALLAPSITRRLVERYARPQVVAGGRPEALARLTARETEVFRCSRGA